MTRRPAIALAALLALSLNAFAAFGADAGDVPQALATGDFNRDGFVDLAVANAFSDDVSILLGQPGGGFLKIRDIPVGLGQPGAPDDLPRDIVAADLDNDGFLDLAVSCQGFFFNPPSVTVLLGRGDAAANFNVHATIDLFFGAGRSAPNLPAPSSPKRAPGGVAGFPMPLAAGDADGDGVADLVLGVPGGPEIWVLRGNGEGFYPNGEYAIVSLAASGDIAIEDLRLFDVDRDGKLDVVGATERGVFALRGGQGQFNAPPAFVAAPSSSLRSVAMADFDGDGRYDLAALDSLGSLRVYHSFGIDGTHRPPVQLVANALLQSGSDMAATDWNGDGRMDVVAAVGGASRVVVVSPSLFPGQAVIGNMPVATSPRAVALVDLDHDGLMDALTANEGDEQNPMNDDVSVAANANEPTRLPAGSGPLNPLVADLQVAAGPAVADASGLGASIDGRVWATDWRSNLVTEVLPFGGGASFKNTPGQVYDAGAWGVAMASDIAIDPSGSVAFLVDRADSDIAVVDLETGTLLDSIGADLCPSSPSGCLDGPIGLFGVAYDARLGGRLHVAAPALGGVATIDMDGDVVAFHPVANLPYDLALDPGGDTLFASHPGRFRVLAYNATTGARTPQFDVDPRAFGPLYRNARVAGVAFPSDFGGHLFLATTDNGLVRTIPGVSFAESTCGLAPGAAVASMAPLGEPASTTLCALDLGLPPVAIVADALDPEATRVFSLQAALAGPNNFEPGAIAWSPLTNEILLVDRRRLLLARYALDTGGAQAAFAGFYDYEPLRPAGLRPGPILGMAIAPNGAEAMANVDGQIVALPLPEAPASPLGAPRVAAQLSLANNPGDLAYREGELIYAFADAPALGGFDGGAGEPRYTAPGAFQAFGAGGVATYAATGAALVSDPATGRVFSYQVSEPGFPSEGMHGLVVR